jgi:type IV pilus assembly protein PilC
MARYLYKAVTQDGKLLSGDIDADSIETANRLLGEKGYIPSEIREPSEMIPPISWTLFREWISPVKIPELILFTKQFRTLMNAGISIMSVFTILEAQCENVTIKKIMSSMARNLKEGATLTTAFRNHKKTFNDLYCSMIHAGETSGKLSEILDRLIYIMDHEHRVKSDIKSAMQYPMIVGIFLIAAFFILLTFVIPKFVSIFMKSGIDLPLPTRICMGLYTFLNNHWMAIIIVTFLVGIGTVYFLQTKRGKLIRDMFLLRLPLLGPLFIKAAMSRFASLFSILLSSGVGILEAINILSATIGNHAISREFEKVKGRLEEGRGIAQPLKKAKYFTPIVINMIAIGEESGNLDQMLGEISTHYDAEVEYAMKKLSDSIGPLLTLSLAGIVGFFALAIFLPMWDLTKILK